MDIIVELQDRTGEQSIDLHNWHNIKRIRATIWSVYPGTKYQDLCISGFGIDFEERREYEWQQENN